jgi:hypothetical protein
MAFCRLINTLLQPRSVLLRDIKPLLTLVLHSVPASAMAQQESICSALSCMMCQQWNSFPPVGWRISRIGSSHTWSKRPLPRVGWYLWLPAESYDSEPPADPLLACAKSRRVFLTHTGITAKG